VAHVFRSTSKTPFIKFSGEERYNTTSSTIKGLISCSLTYIFLPNILHFMLENESEELRATDGKMANHRTQERRNCHLDLCEVSLRRRKSLFVL